MYYSYAVGESASIIGCLSPLKSFFLPTLLVGLSFSSQPLSRVSGVRGRSFEGERGSMYVVCCSRSGVLVISEDGERGSLKPFLQPSLPLLVIGFGELIRRGDSTATDVELPMITIQKVLVQQLLLRSNNTKGCVIYDGGSRSRGAGASSQPARCIQNI